MKLVHLIHIIQKALEASGSRRASAPAPAPVYTVNTVSGFAASSKTFTGAMQAIRCLPARERSSAQIFDENGYCLYR